MSMTLEMWNRTLSQAGRHGVLLPEEQSLSQWGMFRVLSRVERFYLRDMGLGPFGYVSKIITDRGAFTSATTQSAVEEHGIDIRMQNDNKALALHFGFEPDEIEILP